MHGLSQMVLRLLLLLPILALPACSILTPPGAEPPASTAALPKLLQTVPNYAKAPCWMQRRWAAQNSVIATAKSTLAGSDREIVYKAPCDMDAKEPPATAAQPKTKAA